MLNRRGFLSGTAGLTLTGQAFARPQLGTRRPGGTVRLLAPVPDLSEPIAFRTVEDAVIAAQCLDTLVRLEWDNFVRPRLLESIEPSADQRVWVLTLRADLYWSDGEPLTLDHVLWNLRRFADTEGPSPISPSFATAAVGRGKDPRKVNDARTFRKLDARRIEISLTDALPGLAEMLAHPSALILHPGDKGRFGPGSRGTGPYALEKIMPGKSARLVRRERANFMPAVLDAVELIDPAGRPLADLLEAGDADGAAQAGLVELTRLAALRRFSTLSVLTGETSLIRLKADGPPFDDSRVRRALKAALDRDALLTRTYLGRGRPGEHHPVVPTALDYAPGAPVPDDRDLARRLLAEAMPAEGLAIELLTPAEPVADVLLARAVAQAWDEAGVKTTLKIVPLRGYAKELAKSVVGLVPSPHFGQGIVAMATAFRSDSSGNDTGWRDPRADALIDRGLAIIDPVQRKPVMAELQAMVAQDGPVCLPVWREVFSVMDKRLSGFRRHPLGWWFAESWSLPA